VSPSDVVLEHHVLPGRHRKLLKKGTADPSKWKRNAKASRRMHGEGRQPGNSSCSCCDAKLNAESTIKLFQDFCDVDWNTKRDFVLCFQTQKLWELLAKLLVRLVEESQLFFIICPQSRHASKYARTSFCLH